MRIIRPTIAALNSQLYSCRIFKQGYKLQHVCTIKVSFRFLFTMHNTTVCDSCDPNCHSAPFFLSPTQPEAAANPGLGAN